MFSPPLFFWTFPRDTWWVYNLFSLKHPYIHLQSITLFYHSNLILEVPFISHHVISSTSPCLFGPALFCYAPFCSCSNCTSPMVIHMFPYLWVSWSQRKKHVCRNLLSLPLTVCLLFPVQASKTSERCHWLLTVPLNAHVREPLLRQKVSTIAALDSSNRSIQVTVLPRGRQSESGSQRVSFHFLYFSQSVCVCVFTGLWTFPLCLFHPVTPGPECKMTCLAAGLMMLSKERRWLGLLPICWKAKGKWHRCAPSLPFQLGVCVI